MALSPEGVTGINADRAVLTGDSLEAPAGSDPRVWFNSTAFASNPVETFGTTGVGIMTGPNQYSWNMGIFKNFRVTERVNVQLRSEYFNVFNQTNFGNPNTNRSSGGFGTITCTHGFSGDPRIIQFGLKLMF